MTGTVHYVLYRFLPYLTLVSLECDMFRAEFVEKLKTPFFLISFLLWDNVEKYRREGQTRDDNALRGMRMRITFKNRHSELVILIAIPLKQWYHECVSVLRHTYVPRSLIFNSKWHGWLRLNFDTHVQDVSEVRTLQIPS